LRLVAMAALMAGGGAVPAAEATKPAKPVAGAKPFGKSASSLARIACANTGAAPSVEMPITKGERLTMAPKEKSQ